MTSPVEQYATITKAVCGLIERHAENDRTRIAYLVARAALLQVGSKTAAAQKAYEIADEFATSGHGLDE